MPTAAEMTLTLERYLERVAAHDPDGAVALFASDVSVEDPVAGPPGSHVVGRDDVLAFFRKGFERSRPNPIPTGRIRATTADAAAMPFRLQLTIRGQRMEVDVIDVVRFDEAGQIRSLRAFWSIDDMRVAPPTSD